MATVISGDLHGLDTKDIFELSRAPNVYDYTLTASGGGHLRFKVEAYSPQLIGESSGSARWYEIEGRSRIDSGTTLTGSFTVPEVRLSSSVMAEKTTIKIIFSRALGTEGVDYRLEFQHR